MEDQRKCQYGSKQCISSVFKEWDDKYYCKEHYGKAIVVNKPPNKEYAEKTRAILREHKVYTTNLRYLFSFYGTHVYEANFNGELFMVKVQITEETQEEMYESGIYKQTYVGLSTELNIVDMNGYNNVLFDALYYKHNEYICIVNVPHECTLREYIKMDDRRDNTWILTEIIREVKGLHDKQFIHCALNPDSFVYIDGHIKLASFISAARYVSDMGEVYGSVPYKFVGDPLFSSINISEFNTGLRNDDVENVLWLKLWLTDGKRFKRIEKATSITSIITEKRLYLRSIHREQNTLSGAADWDSLFE